MQFLSLQPLHTLIASKLKSQSSGSNDESAHIDKDLSVDSFSREVKVFVSLDIEGRHQLQQL